MTHKNGKQLHSRGGIDPIQFFIDELFDAVHRKLGFAFSHDEEPVPVSDPFPEDVHFQVLVLVVPDIGSDQFPLHGNPVVPDQQGGKVLVGFVLQEILNRPGIAGEQILWEDRSWVMELGLHKS